MARNVQCPTCTFCGKASVLTLTDAEWARLTSGKDIQSAFPKWTPAQRELLISGMHAECWEQAFPLCIKCGELVEGEADGTQDPLTSKWRHNECPTADFTFGGL